MIYNILSTAEVVISIIIIGLILFQPSKTDNNAGLFDPTITMSKIKISLYSYENKMKFLTAIAGVIWAIIAILLLVFN